MSETTNATSSWRRAGSPDETARQRPFSAARSRSARLATASFAGLIGVSLALGATSAQADTIAASASTTSVSPYADGPNAGSNSGANGSNNDFNGSANTSNHGPKGAGESDAPKGLEKFYRQKLTWSECKGKDRAGMQCAQAQVPLDYKKPGGKTITISMLKVPAKSGKPIRSLFVNPGGPGGSGIDEAVRLSKSLKPEMLDKYDVVGFDPRGVGASTPVKCADAAALNTFIIGADYDLSTAKGRQQQQEEAKKIADGCEKRSGELLAHVGTESAARDMDVLRGLVGDKKLNYLGFSYGTELGGTYADLFPKKVGRMVLDGAAEPQLGSARMLYEMTLGFDKSFGRYAKRCIDGGKCALGTTVKAAKKKMRALFDQAAKKPFPTSNPNRKLTRSLLTSEVRQYLYSDASWPDLDEKLRKLVKENDGSAFVESGSDSGPTASSNGAEALIAINCADYVLDPQSEYAKYSERLKREAPVFGAEGVDTKDRYICAGLRHHPKKNPGRYVAKGSAPIVVIGVRHDPATLYSWTQTFAGALDNSVLLTWEGEGHVAYARAGSCIKAPVDKYLLTGEVPKDGLVCPVEKPQGQRQNAAERISPPVG